MRDYVIFSDIYEKIQYHRACDLYLLDICVLTKNVLNILKMKQNLGLQLFEHN